MNSRNKYASNPTYGAGKRIPMRKKSEPIDRRPPAANPNPAEPMPGVERGYPFTQIPTQGNLGQQGYPPMPQQGNNYGYSQQPYPSQPYPKQQKPSQQAYPQDPYTQQPYPNPYNNQTSYPSLQHQAPAQNSQDFTFVQNDGHPMDSVSINDTLVKILLLAVLPLLFIVTLLMPDQSVLKWIFAVASVAGLVGMWFFSGFASSAKTTLSLVYIALLLMTVVTLWVAPSAPVDKNRSNSLQASSSQNGMSDIQNQPPQQSPQSSLPGLIDEEPADTDETVPDADNALVSESVTVLKDFFYFWSANQPAEMLKLCAPSWKGSLSKNAEGELFTLMRNRISSDLVIENVSGTDADLTRTITCTAMVNMRNTRPIAKMRFQIVMLKENGSWYVSPVSLASNIPMESEDSNAGQADMAAQALAEENKNISTTPPAPDGNTKLYYNPDGGSYYHSDPNCTSLAPKYLPLKTSFYYKDINSSKYKALRPCLKCNAPAR